MQLELEAHDGSVLRLGLDGDHQVDSSSSSRLVASRGRGGMGVDAITTLPLDKADLVESNLGVVRKRLSLSRPRVELSLLDSPADFNDEDSPITTLVLMRSRHHVTIWRPRSPFDREEDIVAQASALGMAETERGARVATRNFSVQHADISLNIAGVGVLTVSQRTADSTPPWRGASIRGHEVWRNAAGSDGQQESLVIGSRTAFGVMMAAAPEHTRGRSQAQRQGGRGHGQGRLLGLADQIFLVEWDDASRG